MAISINNDFMHHRNFLFYLIDRVNHKFFPRNVQTIYYKYRILIFPNLPSVFNARLNVLDISRVARFL